MWVSLSGAQFDGRVRREEKPLRAGHLARSSVRAVTRATVVRLWTKLGEVSPKVWLDADLLGRSARRKVRYGLHEGVAVRSISRVIPAVIAGAVGMGAGLGIGLVAASHGSQARRVVRPPLASPRQLSGLGRGQLVRDSGRNWAYESIPIDVKGNGRYFFDFGPVPASFDYPSNPSGIAFDWPSDSRFSVVGATAPHYVALRGKRYVQMGFSVSHFSSPYRGYRAWIY